MGRAVEPVLRVRDVSKRYGDRPVLDGLSLDLERGSMTLLTGRSGSGKSTLFKLLAGLDRPTSGSIVLDGRDITRLTERELSELRTSGVGLVFQSFNLLSDLTVLENVRLPLDIAGVGRKQADQRARELLAVVGLADRGLARPNTLSGGEQQRVAVARALTNEPALLLADEPTGNLDRANAENVFSLFEDLNRRLGATILIISHDDLAVRRFPSHLHLDEGRLHRIAREGVADARSPVRAS